MDKVIKQTKWIKNRKKILVTLSLVGSILIFFLIKTRTISPDLEYSKLKIGKIELGEFQEVVIGNGIIESKNTILIDAKQGGIITEILAEDGDMVDAGDVLLRLSNDAVMLDYMQRETQIVEQINNLRNTRVNLYQNLRTSEDRLEEYRNQYVISKRQYVIDSIMLASNGLAKNKFEESSINFKFLLEKVKTLEKRKNQDKSYHSDQIFRVDNSIELMERNLELIREKLREMTVKASLSGQLNSFSVEPGQVLRQNQTIGRIDVPGKFWIRTLVDQHYLNRLSEGQNGVIQYDGETYELHLSKVLSTVENGQIEVYFDFVNEYPNELRRGQNVHVKIEISAKHKALKLQKGAFFQSSGGQYVYVLSDDRKSAYKQPVLLGKQNPSYYEVLEGLLEGQNVVISTYETFKNYQEIRLITK